DLIGVALERLLLRSHMVDVMTKGQAALETIRAGGRCDVILCDLLMPTMTGIKFHASVAAIAPEQAARIIFMSATPDEAKDFLEALPNACIEKPFEIERLKHLIELVSAASRPGS